MSRNKEHRPNGAAAEGGRPIGGAAFASAAAPLGLCSLFLLINFFHIMNTYGYSLYIPYIFHIYIYMYMS